MTRSVMHFARYCMQAIGTAALLGLLVPSGLLHGQSAALPAAPIDIPAAPAAAPDIPHSPGQGDGSPDGVAPAQPASNTDSNAAGITSPPNGSSGFRSFTGANNGATGPGGFGGQTGFGAWQASGSASGFGSPSGFGARAGMERRGMDGSGGFSSNPFGASPFGAAASGGRAGGNAPLFPVGGAGGAAAFPQLNLNQLMRGSVALPLGSSSSAFRFTYQDALRPGGNFNDLARPSASLMFSTSDLGNGMFLSAGTGYGISSSVGAPAASIGNGNSGPRKNSGPSLNLKLSF